MNAVENLEHPVKRSVLHPRLVLICSGEQLDILIIKLFSSQIAAEQGTAGTLENRGQQTHTQVNLVIIKLFSYINYR